MTNRSVGGGGWFYNPGSGVGQRGITGAYGLNNIGLLIRTWGGVVDRGSNWFKIEDGSGTQVKCVVPTGATVPAMSAYVGVTGLSSCEASGPNLSRVVLIRSDADIREYSQQ
jgi:hypothetical protein